MRIEIQRGHSQLGTFTLEEIRAGLRSGQFWLTDLGRVDGSGEWRTLSALEDFSAAAPPPGAASQASTDRRGPGWENHAALGVFPAVAQTVRGVLLEPAATFAQMKREGGLMTPLLYGVATAYTGTVIGSVLGAVLPLGYPAIDPQTAARLSGSQQLVLTLVFAPLLIALWLFAGAGIKHLVLMLVGGANRPYQTTFRTVCYAYGSCALLFAVPVCGQIIGAVWYFVAAIIGLSQTQETTTGRAAAAVLLPTLLAVCCAALTVFFGIAAVTYLGTNIH